MLPLNYSILNTDKESNAEMAPIAGIASYQQDKLNIFMMMNNFINAMNQLGYKCAYVNKISDQQNNQLDCGLRSMLWLLFIENTISKTRKSVIDSIPKKAVFKGCRFHLGNTEPLRFEENEEDQNLITHNPLRMYSSTDMTVSSLTAANDIH